MTPFQKGKSDKKIRYTFYFAIDRSKITPKQMQAELEEFGFKPVSKEFDSGQFDFAMTIRLEQYYNTSKFAKDLITKYKEHLMEVKIL